MPLDDDREDVVVQSCGDDLLSAAIDDVDAGQRFATMLRDSGEWLEVVAGIDSVVVQFDAATIDVASAAESFAAQLRNPPRSVDLETAFIDVPVCYDIEFGVDLRDVCARLGLSADRFIELHTAAEYRVDMIGFTPGFAYVGGLDDALAVPRLAEPRARVEAGSIGVAQGRTGIYALAGPGGWPIVGRTPMTLFRPDAADPFVVHAGMGIRFRSITRDEFDAAEST